MWDPAFSGLSAQQQQQQQQQRSPDLTIRPTTAATSASATTDCDRHTLHTFEAKQPESHPVVQQVLTTDRQSARLNDSDTSSYQHEYLSPSSQDGIGEPSNLLTGPPPPLSSSNGAITSEILTTIPQKKNASVVHTAGPNLHQSLVLGDIGRSYKFDKPNNIPMEIDTIGSSYQHSPALSPDPTDDNAQIQFPDEPTPSPPPPPSETVPLLLPPHASTPEQNYPKDQRSTSSTPVAASVPALTPARLPSTPPPRNSRDTSPCIARLSIPTSHMSLFHDALKSPPDPDLKIRKKTVRFNKTNSPPRHEHRHERREAEGSGSYSSSNKSSSASSSSSHAASSKSIFGSTKSSSLQPPIVEKDAEERMAELMELKQMKIRQEDLLHLKEQVFQTGQNLEEKQTVLDEVRAERKVLHSELNRYIAMVKQVQKDLELVTHAETQLTKERDQLSQHLAQLRDHDFKVLKEEVDQLRSKKGLRPLPSLEQEQEEFMGRYLEERRGQWREDGVLQDSSSSSSHQPSSTSGAAAAAGDTSGHRHGAGSSPSSSVVAAATSSRSSRTPTSSITTVGPSTSRSRARDTTESRPNRTHQFSSSSSTHSRNYSNNSSSSKSKHESSSRHNSSSRSSSRRQSSRSRSSSPPTQSSSSRDERSKKRSRY